MMDEFQRLRQKMQQHQGAAARTPPHHRSSPSPTQSKSPTRHQHDGYYPDHVLTSSNHEEGFLVDELQALRSKMNKQLPRSPNNTSSNNAAQMAVVGTPLHQPLRPPPPPSQQSGGTPQQNHPHARPGMPSPASSVTPQHRHSKQLQGRASSPKQQYQHLPHYTTSYSAPQRERVHSNPKQQQQSYPPPLMQRVPSQQQQAYPPTHMQRVPSNQQQVYPLPQIQRVPSNQHQSYPPPQMQLVPSNSSQQQPYAQEMPPFPYTVPVQPPTQSARTQKAAQSHLQAPVSSTTRMPVATHSSIPAYHPTMSQYPSQTLPLSQDYMVTESPTMTVAMTRAVSQQHERPTMTPSMKRAVSHQHERPTIIHPFNQPQITLQRPTTAQYISEKHTAVDYSTTAKSLIQSHFPTQRAPLRIRAQQIVAAKAGNTSTASQTGLMAIPQADPSASSQSESIATDVPIPTDESDDDEGLSAGLALPHFPPSDVKRPIASSAVSEDDEPPPAHARSPTQHGHEELSAMLKAKSFSDGAEEPPATRARSPATPERNPAMFHGNNSDIEDDPPPPPTRPPTPPRQGTPSPWLTARSFSDDDEPSPPPARPPTPPPREKSSPKVTTKTFSSDEDESAQVSTQSRREKTSPKASGNKAPTSILSKKQDQGNDPASTVHSAMDDSKSTLGKKSPRGKKKGGGVSFGSVRVRTHLCRLGDNPSVSSGLPVELDWDHIESETFTIQSFESMGGGQPKDVKRLSQDERKAMLRKRGHSRQSFVKAADEIDSIKSSRLETRQLDEAEEEKQQSKLEEFQRLMAQDSSRPPRRRQEEDGKSEGKKVSRSSDTRLESSTESSRKSRKSRPRSASPPPPPTDSPKGFLGFRKGSSPKNSPKRDRSDKS